MHAPKRTCTHAKVQTPQKRAHLSTAIAPQHPAARPISPHGLFALSRTDPATGQALASAELVPNVSLRNAIRLAFPSSMDSEEERGQNEEDEDEEQERAGRKGG